MKRQLSLFEDQRLDLEGARALSLASLREYGRKYSRWAIAYSGGKDSTATLLFVAWAIETGQIDPPETLTILYGDTRMESPPLQRGAMDLLQTMTERGHTSIVVMPNMDNRFFVYMLGRGVPPPSNTFRWCTYHLKIEPMEQELASLRAKTGKKLLMLTGVRLGESTVRDQRIALSCSKTSGECGQGWFQAAPPESVADTLAPLMHWRLCHVYDWLYFDYQMHNYDATTIALIYGEDEVRTGCIACNLASRDVALERLIKQPGYAHYAALLELKTLYRDLKRPENRLRKSEPEMRQDGKYSKNAQRLGPLTFEARAYGLERVLDIQNRAGVDLINAEENSRIRQLWAANTWPNGWAGDEITGDIAIDTVRVTPGNQLVTQALLVR